MQVIYGASDDLIELEGNVTEEVYVPSGEVVYIAFSDSTLVRVHYGNDGLWTIRVVEVGLSCYELFTATEPASDQYSDRLTLYGDIQWAVVGGLARAQGKA